jgi:hypothetical protein
MTLYALDQVHVEPESKVQAEQPQLEAITNLVGSRQAPVHSISIPYLLF